MGSSKGLPEGSFGLGATRHRQITLTALVDPTFELRLVGFDDDGVLPGVTDMLVREAEESENADPETVRAALRRVAEYWLAPEFAEFSDGTELVLDEGQEAECSATVELGGPGAYAFAFGAFIEGRLVAATEPELIDLLDNGIAVAL